MIGKISNREGELVSIITPLYNSAAFIGKTIESIIKQTYPNWELLITDDCSTDNSLEIVNEFVLKDNRIKLFKLDKNSGAGVARNNSIREASGKYIAFCDSDDIWFPNKLQVQLKLMVNEQLSFTYSSYNKINEEGDVVGAFYPPLSISYSDLLKTCHIGCLTAIYDCSQLGKIYMPSIRRRQDYALWLRIFKSIGYSKGVGDILASYRIRNNSISRNKIKAATYHWRILREEETLSMVKAFYYFCHYFIYGFKKYIK